MTATQVAVVTAYDMSYGAGGTWDLAAFLPGNVIVFFLLSQCSR